MAVGINFSFPTSLVSLAAVSNVPIPFTRLLFASLPFDSICHSDCGFSLRIMSSCAAPPCVCLYFSRVFLLCSVSLNIWRSAHVVLVSCREERVIRWFLDGSHILESFFFSRVMSHPTLLCSQIMTSFSYVLLVSPEGRLNTVAKGITATTSLKETAMSW